MRSTLFLSGLVGFVGCVISACFIHTDPPPPRTEITSATVPQTGSVATTSNPRLEGLENEAYLVVSDEIRDICKLPSERGTQPLFESGRYEIRGDAGQQLEGLALCLATGPLQGRRIRIEGHTDRRGGQAYNRELGQKRADATKAHLAARGIANDRMQAISLGMSEAKGTDDNSYYWDRRVEIELVPENPTIRRY